MLPLCCFGVDSVVVYIDVMQERAKGVSGLPEGL
jgi:hypothetical protein